MLAAVLSLVVLAVAFPSGAPSAQEFVLHTFKCPPHVTYKVNWQNKIETQPTDFPLSSSYENLTHTAPFKDSAVNVSANTVQCRYVSSDGHPQAPYIYKVHRKIISCTGHPAATFECKLQKN
jgi:hypothetical protein